MRMTRDDLTTDDKVDLTSHAGDDLQMITEQRNLTECESGRFKATENANCCSE